MHQSLNRAQAGCFMTRTITPQQLHERIRTDPAVRLIDVRTPAEFREVHVAAATNVPLDQLDPADGRLREGGSPLYVVCRSGSRARQACERLERAGLVNVFNVEGGTQACETAGLPVVRGRASMSLERQVRIAAGSLVLVGAGLGWFVHPAYVGLAAFVGAGLVFAGLTDTCGMALVLARMPWNQVKAESQACAVR